MKENSCVRIFSGVEFTVEFTVEKAARPWHANDRKYLE